ncbi:MAG TPA: M20 aminoacylase family protein [Acetobacteraceae bacterium]|nr:M20 aminoacylase family protein [Acetobacteraceae bacterium]
MTDTAMLDRIRGMHPELTAIRRDIHAHPELGMEEVRTSAIVAAKLREYGVQEIVEGVGETGVVATIRGKRPGQRAIGLRADMDALAIHEQTGLSYASQNQGKMHACGHDGHTAMLLGAARYLAGNPDFGGTVHLIFQPAEEGRGGAKAMLKDGLFDRFPCDAVYGLHNGPGMEAHKIGTCVGPMLAASGRFGVTFRGTGGHGGSSPHLATDATMVQAHFVLGLQGIVGRNVPPMETAVISVGHINGGQRESLNVIPSDVFVGGTVRCFNTDVEEMLGKRIEELAQTLARAYGCTAEVEVKWGTPPLVNSEEHAKVVAEAARRVVGDEKVDPAIPPITGGEDFAFMMQARPGAFIFLGNGVAPDGSFHTVHTPKYDFNDEIIPTGVAYWVSLVQQELGSP